MFNTSIISRLLYTTVIAAGGFIENKFIKITEDAGESNKKILFNILNTNKDTEYGKIYRFSNIKTIEDYKSNIPLSDYEYYEPYIERMAQGERNILVKEAVEYFGHTSGTTGKQKLIPVTKTSRLKASKYMALLIQKYAYNNFKDNWNYGRGLMIADIVMTTYTKCGIPICSATSGGMKGIEKIIPYLYTSPLEVMYIKDKKVANYLHLLFALKEYNLMYIGSVFISGVLDLLREMEKSYTLLIRDIRRGKISNELNIDEALRRRLNSYLSPNSSRADQLKKEFDKGFQGICRRIWPNLSYITCVTGANFSIYDELVNYYTGSLPIYSPSLAATEGMMGINPYGNKIQYVIIPDTVFYEFIDIDENKENITYCIDNLKKNRCYEIAITNYSGLYRYKIGDVVKVVDFYNNSPVVEFLYRKNQALNMVAEKTTEAQLSEAVKNTMKAFNLDLIDYSSMADNSISPGCYKIFLEIKQPIGKGLTISLKERLDKELQNTNLAYGRFRKLGRLASVNMVIVKPNTFNRLKETMNNKGVSKNQIKIPRVINEKSDLISVLNNNKIKS